MSSRELQIAISRVLQTAWNDRPAILMEAVDAVEEAVKWALIALAAIPINLADARHRTVLSLFASLIEFSDCCVKLARLGAFTGIPVLGRSAIEAYVDLKNLIEDGAYLGVLELAHDKEWARLIEQAVEHDNPFVASLANLSDVEEHRSRLDARIRQTLADGVPKRMTKEDKFRKAGMSQEYEAIYGVLCAAAHNSPSALIGRHIDVNTWPVQFVVGRRDPAWVDSTTSALAALLRSAGHMVVAYAEALVPTTARLDGAIARMDAAIAHGSG